MQVKFTVIGEPKGKGRPRVTRSRQTGRSITYTPEQTVIYENLIRYSYQEQCRGAYLDGTIAADIVAYFPIPKSTSKKNREKMLSGEIMHIKKPDCDNLVKSVLDALNKIAYPDDAQVAYVSIEKYYAEQPRIEVTLREMNDHEKKTEDTNTN